MSKKKSFIFILSSFLILSSYSYSNQNKMMNEYQLKKIIINEVKDDLYIDFLSDEELLERDDDSENYIISEINIDKKNAELEIFAMEDDNYKIVVDNIKILDEEYIISSKLFEIKDFNDSFEPLNRRMYAFNVQLDEKVMYPVAQIYNAVIPKPVRSGITNFFSNFNEIPTTVNAILQLNPKKALNSIGRFAINSTIGVGGLFDVAKDMNMPRDNETFDETLGKYGVPSGSFVVLPVMGPRTVRDTFGMAVDGLIKGQVKGLVYDELFYDNNVLDKTSVSITESVLGALDTRAKIPLKFGETNSPFEYDIIKIILFNFKNIQVVK